MHLNEEYVGDGVYAYTDRAGQIWLWCDRDNARHEIALDRVTFQALLAYSKRVWAVSAGEPY